MFYSTPGVILLLLCVRVWTWMIFRLVDDDDFLCIILTTTCVAFLRGPLSAPVGMGGRMTSEIRPEWNVRDSM